MITLDIDVKHNASSVARELSGLADRMEAVPTNAMPEALEVVARDAADEIREIAGGVYWDIETDVEPLPGGARGRVFTPPSKPHRIEPTQPHGLLVFEIGGDTVFVRGGVDHPGSNPVDWTGGVSMTTPQKVRSVFAEHLQGVVKGGVSAMPQGVL